MDLTGKKVAVIGTGASAIQFVPIIAEQVGQLQLYERTPPWVLGRRNRTIPTSVQRLFAKMPLTRNLFRALNYWIAESMAPGSTDTATCTSRWNGRAGPTSARASRIRRWWPSSPRLSVRLQAPSFFLHVLPGAGVAQRRAGHGRHRRGTAREHCGRRRRRARGRRHHLRHRVQPHR